MRLPSSIEVGRSIRMLMSSLECHRVARHVTVIMLDVMSEGYLVGGCGYCQRVHAQWERFQDNVDDVIPPSSEYA